MGGITREGTIRWGAIKRSSGRIIKAFNHWLQYRSVSGRYARYLTTADITELPLELCEGLIKEFLADSDVFITESWTPGGKVSCQVLVKTWNGHLAAQYTTRNKGSRRAANIDAIEWCFEWMGRKVSAKGLEDFKEAVISVPDAEE